MATAHLRRWSLLAAMAGALLLAAAPTQAAVRGDFIARNVGSCEMGTTGVLCITFGFHPGASARLNRRGHVKLCRGIKCLGDPGEGTPTLKPGHSKRIGRFRCTVHTKSVTCRVIRTGKGFRMTLNNVKRVG
jgi:hypothetical protein